VWKAEAPTLDGMLSELSSSIVIQIYDLFPVQMSFFANSNPCSLCVYFKQPHEHEGNPYVVNVTPTQASKFRFEKCIKQ
jgi:hypothetical protein